MNQQTKANLYDKMQDQVQEMMTALGGPPSIAIQAQMVNLPPAGAVSTVNPAVVPGGILREALVAVLADEIENRNPPAAGNPAWGAGGVAPGGGVNNNTRYIIAHYFGAPGGAGPGR